MKHECEREGLIYIMRFETIVLVISVQSGAGYFMQAHHTSTCRCTAHNFRQGEHSIGRKSTTSRGNEFPGRGPHVSLPERSWRSRHIKVSPELSAGNLGGKGGRF